MAPSQNHALTLIYLKQTMTNPSFPLIWIIVFLVHVSLEGHPSVHHPFLMEAARWKRWLVGFLWTTDKGKELRTSFAEAYFEEKYKDYMQTLSVIEQRSKDSLQGYIEDFVVFWEIFQSQVWSSSAYCEPLGNLAKQYMKPNVNATTVSKNMCIKAHCDNSKKLGDSFGKGISNYLVNNQRGVLKKQESNVKRQKDSVSKVIKRHNKGQQTKYTTPTHVSAEDISNHLQEMNIIDD
eukprot:1129961_1